MADDYTRTWYDYVDDLDQEALNDLEARMEARSVAGAAGIELGYASTSGTFTTTSGTAGGVPVTGLSVTVVVGSRPINVRVRAPSWSCNAGFGGVLYLNTDGSTAGVMAGLLGTAITIPLDSTRRLSPAAGTHTYAIYARNTSAGTLTINADAGTTTLNSPMAIQIVEV